MSEKLNIKIDKPCSEKFSDFTSTDKGGYCNSCKKEVTDFTKMSDKEILNYFTNQKQNTCGLFLDNQLKTYSTVNSLINKQKPNAFISSVFGFSLFSILSFTNSYSQEKPKELETIKIATDKEVQNTDSLDVNKKHLIKGIVSDATGPLPGANVYLKGTNTGTQTDFDGKFIFPIPLKVGDILVINFIGLKEQLIFITKQNIDVVLNYDVNMKMETCVTMGEVSTNKVYRSKRTFFHRIKSIFTNE